MRHRYLAAVLALVVGLATVMTLVLHGHQFAIFSPAGPVARQERDLIYFALGLSLLVVVPVFAMTIGIAWKYRAGNTKADYQPNWDHNVAAETVWWTIPTLLIGILAVVTYVSTHELDPGKALASSRAPIAIQVVALPWKWLFIYPDQHVATVNYLDIPVNTPVKFTITSDAPMNSFWIPRLGGQIYAMSGMSTALNLMATTQGDYNGLSANISGKGFAGMKFVVHATSEASYDTWLESAEAAPAQLDPQTYQALAQPSENNVAATYTLTDPNLYDEIVMKYMAGDSANMEMMNQ